MYGRLSNCRPKKRPCWINSTSRPTSNLSPKNQIKAFLIKCGKCSRETEAGSRKSDVGCRMSEVTLLQSSCLTSDLRHRTSDLRFPTSGLDVFCLFHRSFLPFL